MGQIAATGLSPEAIQRLLGGHREFLAFLERRVESREAAEDILQEAFVRGLERGGEVRDEDSVVAWFYRLLRNAVVDHYRHKASAERAMEAYGREFVSVEPAPEIQEEICRCLSGLLDSLKPEYRQALRLVDMEDGSLKELATQVGISEGNAAVRVHRAREALRKQVRLSCGICAEHGCLNCSCGKSSDGCAMQTA